MRSAAEFRENRKEKAEIGYRDGTRRRYPEYGSRKSLCARHCLSVHRCGRRIQCHNSKFPTCPRRAPYHGACTTAKSSTLGVRAMRACESLQPPTHQRSNSTSRDWCSLATASLRAGVGRRIARRCHALVACRACSTVLWRSIGHLRCHLPSQRIARSISCGACKQANSHHL